MQSACVHATEGATTKAMMAATTRTVGVGTYAQTTTPWSNEGNGGHGQTSASVGTGERTRGQMDERGHGDGQMSMGTDE